jgi:hypothetical protein
MLWLASGSLAAALLRPSPSANRPQEAFGATGHEDDDPRVEVWHYRAKIPSPGQRSPGDLKGAILHTTSGGSDTSAEEAVAHLKASNLAGNYRGYEAIVDQNGTTYELLPPGTISPHAGIDAGHLRRQQGVELHGGNNRSFIGLAFLNRGWSPTPREGWIESDPPPAELQKRAIAEGWGRYSPSVKAQMAKGALPKAWWQPFPLSQIEGGARYLAKLFAENGVNDPELTGHRDVASWKADPGPAFPLAAFSRRVRQLLHQRHLRERQLDRPST